MLNVVNFVSTKVKFVFFNSLQDFEGGCCLARSLSEANLECVDSEERVQDVWQAHLDELEMCRQEQVNKQTSRVQVSLAVLGGFPRVSRGLRS